MRGRGCVAGGACMAREGHAWQAACMAGSVCVRRDGHCRGRYASYWNAFLFHAEERKTVCVSTIYLQLKATKTQSYSIKNNDYSLRCSFFEFALSN